MTIEDTDKESGLLYKAPRVTLADIEGKIDIRCDITGAEATNLDDGRLKILSICICVLQNGFTVIGKSAPVSSENYNADYGRKLAYEDCIRQIWPLEGYLLRQKLHEQEEC